MTAPGAGSGIVDIGYVRCVAWGVNRSARYVPRASCLTQALAGQYLLSQRGIASHIRFGIDRNSRDRIKAHAWLISGELIVLGGDSGEMRNFAHVADFGSVR